MDVLGVLGVGKCLCTFCVLYVGVSGPCVNEHTIDSSELDGKVYVARTDQFCAYRIFVVKNV